jgi:hypothetical protein
MRVNLVLFELLWLTASVGCQPPKRPAPKHAAPSASALQALLAPHAASPFRVDGNQLRQEQPRLPDTGEWRCADRGKVVWCAGGEAAAGVVSGPPDAGYRCGPRWGTTTGERVCIDQHPDYPGDSYECAFEQEHGMTRVCRSAAAWEGSTLAARALPACWLDRDCPSGRCDRGACGCSVNQDCLGGPCAGGLCSQVKP